MRLFEVLQPLLESFKQAKKAFMSKHGVGAEEVNITIGDFRRIKDRLSPPENDISHWVKRGWHEFFLFVQKQKRKKTKGQIRQEIKQDDNILEIVDDDYMNIVVPFSTKAACNYGQRGDWCISTRTMEDNLFHEYTMDGKVFFIFTPTSNSNLAYTDTEKYGVSDLQDSFTLEVRTYNNRLILWDKHNEKLEDKEMIRVLFDEMEIEMGGLTIDDLISKADEIVGEIQDNVREEETDMASEIIDNLLESPTIQTIEETMSELYDREDAMELYELAHDKNIAEIMESIIMTELKNSSSYMNRHDFEVIFDYYLKIRVGIPSEAMQIITQLIENGDISVDEARGIIDSIVEEVDYIVDGMDMYVNPIIDSLYVAYANYSPLVDSIDPILELFDFSRLLQRIDIPEQRDKIEEALLQKMYNNPNDESILEDVKDYENNSKIGRPFMETFLSKREKRRGYGAPDERQQEISELDYSLIYKDENHKVVQPTNDEVYQRSSSNYSLLSQVPKSVQSSDYTYILVEHPFNIRMIINVYEMYFVSVFNGKLSPDDLKRLYGDEPAVMAILEDVKDDFIQYSRSDVSVAQILFDLNVLSQSEYEYFIDSHVKFITLSFILMNMKPWFKKNMVSEQWFIDFLHENINMFTSIIVNDEERHSVMKELVERANHLKKEGFVSNALVYATQKLKDEIT